MAIKEIAKRSLPPQMWRAIVKRRYKLRPSPLDPWRRTTPVAPNGHVRGGSVDLYYIRQFLLQHHLDIRGSVLEVADNGYTKRYGMGTGPPGRVAKSDVIHVTEGNPDATLVGNFETGDNIPHDQFDCVILTQTLHFIYDYKAALRNIVLALKPGAVLLCTVPGIAQISRYDAERWGDYYRFTKQSADRILADAGFEGGSKTYGNVLTACGMLHYLAADEFTSEELAVHDDDYPVIVGMYGRKPGEG